MLDDQQIRQLCVDVSRGLWAMRERADDAPHLIFPVKSLASGHATRVSEQESRVLMCQALERMGVWYSVETPTFEGYRFQGATEQSARTDVTVYSSRDPHSRTLNIELKAHNPAPETISKDAEKLAREQVDGLWYHTLDTADLRTLRSLFRKLADGFADVAPERLPEGTRRFSFAFCVLSPRLILWNSVCVDSSGLHQTVAELFADPGTWAATDGDQSVSIADVLAIGAGSAGAWGLTGKKAFVYSPELLEACPQFGERTFLVLGVGSASGFSLRQYSPDGVREAREVAGIKSIDQLVARFSVEDVVPFSPQDNKTAHTEGAYFAQRVASLNESIQ